MYHRHNLCPIGYLSINLYHWQWKVLFLLSPLFKYGHRLTWLPTGDTCPKYKKGKGNVIFHFSINKLSLPFNNLS